MNSPMKFCESEFLLIVSLSIELKWKKVREFFLVIPRLTYFKKSSLLVSQVKYPSSIFVCSPAFLKNEIFLRKYSSWSPYKFTPDQWKPPYYRALGRMLYWHSRVTKFPQIKYVFLGKVIHVFPWNFQVFSIKSRTKLSKELDDKYFKLSQ